MGIMKKRSQLEFDTIIDEQEVKTIKVMCSTPSKDFDWHPGYKSIYVNKVEDADLVLFTGGSDVDPKYYGQKAGKHTGSGGARDAREFALFHQAMELGKPIFGICRGHQLICAALGGTLIQDVSHYSGHIVHTYDDLKFHANSYHHQMIRPLGIKDKYEVLGWVNGGSTRHLDGDNKQIVFNKDEKPEIEVIVYPELNILSIQSHPEWETNFEYNYWLAEQFDKYIKFDDGSSCKC
jgi:gamma-glutamyl-gamma-aminobutyrate hydrolase PuuD